MTIHLPLPFIKRGLTRWDDTVIPMEEVRHRWQSLQAGLAERQLDAVLVFGDLMDAGNVLYLTNFAPFESRMPALVLITRDRVEAVIQISSRDLFFVQPYVWCKVHTCDFLSGDLAQKVAGLLAEQRLRPERVGVAGARAMPARLHRALARQADLSRGDEMDVLLAALRFEKSAAELAAVRGAAETLDLVVEALEDFDGAIWQSEIAAHADYIARQNGAQDFACLFYVNGDGAEPRLPMQADPPGTSALLQEMPTGVFLALQKHGYWAEASCTIFPRAIRGARADASALVRQRFAEVRAHLSERLPVHASHEVWWHEVGLSRLESFGDVLPQRNGASAVALHVAAGEGSRRMHYGRTLILGRSEE